MRAAAGRVSWGSLTMGGAAGWCVALVASASVVGVGGSVAAAAPAAPSVVSMLRAEVSPSDVVDLRVDANRDGFVDRRSARVSDDQAGKNVLGHADGALMLPNIDDDTRRCPAMPEPKDFAKPHDLLRYLKCFDAADEVVNGAADEADLATVAALPMPSLSERATATLAVPLGAGQVRVFMRTSTGWKVVPPGGALPLQELRQGVEFGVEALSVLGMTAWDGVARLTLAVSDGARRSEDSVTLRVAPAIFTHHLQTAESMWYPKPVEPVQDKAQKAFGDEMVAKIRASKAGTVTRGLTSLGLQYVQDVSEPASVSMPRGSTMQSMRVLGVRGKPESGLEGMFNAWRGPDVSAFPLMSGPLNAHLSAGGNVEVIPPYTSPTGRRWPHGRVLMGRIDMDGTVANPDAAVTNYLTAQGKQGPPLYANTAWLAVGHIDEAVSFIPADTPRGWKLAIGDVKTAYALMKRALNAGIGKIGPLPEAQKPLSAYFGPYQNKHVAMVAQELAKIEALLVKETGLAPSEIVRVPVMYAASGLSFKEAFVGDRIATRPGMVRVGAALPNAINSQHIGNGHVVVPGQYGPKVKGKDLMMDAVLAAYRRAGLTPLIVDDRRSAWIGSGDVHCSTSVWRKPTAWWRLT